MLCHLLSIDAVLQRLVYHDWDWRHAARIHDPMASYSSESTQSAGTSLLCRMLVSVGRCAITIHAMSQSSPVHRASPVQSE